MEHKLNQLENRFDIHVADCDSKFKEIAEREDRFLKVQESTALGLNECTLAITQVSRDITELTKVAADVKPLLSVIETGKTAYQYGINTRKFVIWVSTLVVAVGAAWATLSGWVTSHLPH